MEYDRKDDLFVSGHTACAGCGATIIIRNVMRALGDDVIIVNATSCSEIFSSCYPTSAWKVPYIHVTFENAAAVAVGVAKSLEAKGNDHTTVVVIAGDGGTYDIGFGIMSGAMERNENILYVCYDNEAYMNTGIQRSGATPYKAWTTTSQVGKMKQGKQEWKKNITEIAKAHGIPYVATSTSGHLFDLKKKIEKAKKIKGFRFVDVHSPCVPGWKYDPALTVELSKLAVDTGLWKVFEYENGKETITIQPKFIPVEEYFKHQKRFKHLTKEDIEFIQKKVNEDWNR
ncbi:pyruvate synthase subunit beta [Candidatus Micrarchaeota archaeon]|jgi:pyruvate ferredoxin oxidoreductase beta subunit|nr:pyruvate synthase subunit beta [Candidatus Micrarchaeota archaeon]